MRAVPGHWLAGLALGLILLALWLVARPYLGIRHDAIFYSFFALAQLDPVGLGGDLFARYGSQDTFTLFSPLYGTLIARLGLEGGALGIALTGQIAFWAASTCLCAQLLPDRRRWYALALLLVWPGCYSSHNVFHYAEFFASPRPFAEAAVLLAIASILRRGAWSPLPVLLLAGGLLLHPLMSVPGVLVALLLVLAPRRIAGLAVLAVIGLTLALVIAAVRPIGPLAFFDAAWLAIVRERSPYLFVDLWDLLDWQRIAVPLATLSLALVLLERGRVRQLALASLGASVTGFALAAVFSLLAPLVIGVQGQAWRWHWLATWTAVAALVPLAQVCWREGWAARGIYVLLLCGWAGSEDGLGLPCVLLALAAGVALRTRPRLAGGVAWIGALLLVMPLVKVVAIGETLALAALGVSGVALVDLAIHRGGLGPMAAVSLIAACGAALALHQFFERPRQIRFTSAALAAFAPWRERIGRESSVLWAEGGVATWFALGRRNYLSASQTVNVVFSREAAFEMQRRAALIDEYKPSVFHMGWRPSGLHDPVLTPALARRFCALPELDFIVRDRNLEPRLSELYVAGVLVDFELVDCRDVRAGRGFVARPPLAAVRRAAGPATPAQEAR